jgi:hypothetical protein
VKSARGPLAEPLSFGLSARATSQVTLAPGFGLRTYGIDEALREFLISADLAMPQLQCSVPRPQQPYRIVFIGEKVSLKPVLRPIAERVHGELILPTGELSDTLLYGMVKRAAADDRPTVVLYFSDFDPSGYHMPVEVARKVQAHHELRFPDLDIAMYPVALNFEQVRDLDLPSTPLKASERRGDKWRAHWDHEQTEIDALAALRPDELREIAERAIEPFYDPTLQRRIEHAEVMWNVEARRLLRAHPMTRRARRSPRSSTRPRPRSRRSRVLGKSSPTSWRPALPPRSRS